MEPQPLQWKKGLWKSTKIQSREDVEAAVAWLKDKIRKSVFCPECGKEMGLHSHFCESCKQRVSVPKDCDEVLPFISIAFGLGEK